MKRKTSSTPQQRDVVTLADLAPRHRVTGGSERRVFGADMEDTMSSDNITLIRAAKPTKKDLPAGKDVKGGKKRE
jgi:hypothetical protein